jgi:poly(3-hydroxybutyrate) depolymerase
MTQCVVLNSLTWALMIGGALAPTGARADWAQRTIAGTSVLVYTPRSAGSYPTGRGLMIGLHGCTQQNTALRDRGNWEPAADRFGVVVALPQVPNGGVIAGCWDYYGANHTRTSRHDGAVLAIVDALLDDASLDVDPAQVYVSGLSSGGGQAMVLGCLAPDVFAGVGVNAGPTVGTQSSEIARVATNQTAASTTCRRLAGAAAASFDTQLTSVIAGTQDFIVAQGYSTLNAAVFAGLYEAPTESRIDVASLPGFMSAGTGTRYADARGPRVELVFQQGMGHAFPAGSGAGAEISFIASKGVSWPMTMLELFTMQNRRVGAAPLLDAGVADTGVDAGRAPGADAGTSPRVDAGGARADAGAGARADAAAGDDAAAVGDVQPAPIVGEASGCAAVGAEGTAVGAIAVAVVFASRARRRRG